MFHDATLGPRRARVTVPKCLDIILEKRWLPVQAIGIQLGWPGLDPMDNRKVDLCRLVTPSTFPTLCRGRQETSFGVIPPHSPVSMYPGQETLPTTQRRYT
jgi:hypothetical protein